jgi:hypothetical protein
MPHRILSGTVTGLALGSLFSAGLIAGQSANKCLHGDGESADQKARRVTALQLTREINTLEYAAQRESKRFVPLERLPLTAPIPQGFETRLLTDGTSYAFSVKDTTDSCGFGYFSDSYQDGIIYVGQGLR